MAQTFDIRFARSAGLAGLLEEPANAFRWKGAGRLSIDATGISIAVKRGLLTLFARAQSRRIATDHVTHIYREGNALRLEFSTRESARAVLPFWVSDREAAARIVTLLPTQRSVELDEGGGSGRRYRFDRRLIALLLGMLALGAGALLLSRYLAEDLAVPAFEAEARPVPLATQDSSAPSTETTPLTEVGPPSPVSAARRAQGTAAYGTSAYLDPAGIPAPSMDRRSEAAAPGLEGESASVDATTRARPERVGAAGNVPDVPARTAGEIAMEQLAIFRAESNSLRGEYLYARDSLAYERLDAIEAKWLLVTSRIVNTQEFWGGEFYALRELELAISRNWRDHLRILASAQRAGGDRWLMASAEVHLRFAESVESQLLRYPR